MRFAPRLPAGLPTRLAGWGRLGARLCAHVGWRSPLGLLLSGGLAVGLLQLALGLQAAPVASDAWPLLQGGRDLPEGERIGELRGRAGTVDRLYLALSTGEHLAVLTEVQHDASGTRVGILRHELSLDRLAPPGAPVDMEDSDRHGARVAVAVLRCRDPQTECVRTQRIRLTDGQVEAATAASSVQWHFAQAAGARRLLARLAGPWPCTRCPGHAGSG